MTTATRRETVVASEMAVGELVTELEALYGESLRAVVRFGSAVAGEVLPGQSDTNLLIIVDAVSLDALLHKATAVRKWSWRQYREPRFRQANIHTMLVLSVANSPTALSSHVCASAKYLSSRMLKMR